MRLTTDLDKIKLEVIYEMIFERQYRVCIFHRTNIVDLCVCLFNM